MSLSLGNVETQGKLSKQTAGNDWCIMTFARGAVEYLKSFENKRVDLCRQRFDGKKAVIDYPPRWVTVGITGNCSYKCEFCCSHCPESGKNEKTSHQYKMPFNITVEDFKKIVDMCHEAGVPRIHVCGTGEPFLHPRILDIIDYVISIYSHVSLQTDFWKVLFEKKKYVDEIIKRKEHTTYITTDIFPQEVHERIKRGSNFEYLLHCMERISQETDIVFGAHVLLTKKSYKKLTELLYSLHERKINFFLEIVHLLPLGFNEFTSLDNVYMSSDTEITAELKRVRQAASELNMQVSIPPPWDKVNIDGNRCTMFWHKVQLMPSKKISRERWVGNAIPQQCSAVVQGDLFSVGNVLDYDNFMDFWNNDILVGIRKKIMSGELPDPACRFCYTGAQGRFKKISTPDKLMQFIPNSFFLLLRKTKHDFVTFCNAFRNMFRSELLSTAKRMLFFLDDYSKKRFIASTQIDKENDIFQDRVNELSEYFGTTAHEIKRIFKGSKMHDLFNDISTDEKLLQAYRNRTQIAVVNHMLSYTRFDQAYSLVKFFNRIYRPAKRRSTKVLDYGCSIADFGLCFALQGYQVSLCDIKDGNLQLGVWRFDKRGLNYHVIPVTSNNLYPKFSNLDIIVASETLEHLRNPLIAVNNIYEGLNSNGLLWISGYPVIEAEVSTKHPDHLEEAAELRESVFKYILDNFIQVPFEKGFLFKKK